MKHDGKNSHIEKKNDSPKLPISSSDSGPSSKETLMLGSGLLALALGIGGMWMISEDQPLHANPTNAVEIKQVAKGLNPSISESTSETEKSTESMDPTLVAFEEAAAHSEEAGPPDQADVYFGFDQASLSEEAAIVLQEKIDYLKEKEGWQITVQGHADQHGSDAYNQRLGLRRAEAVKAYLTAQGIEESVIQTESMGSQNSICTEDSEECLQKNRRAHITLSSEHASTTMAAPLVAEIITSEPENILTVESEDVNRSLTDNDVATETALLSNTIEEETASEATTTSESLP
ncbi:OmpA family protein [Candidatus Nitrospira salsa]